MLGDVLELYYNNGRTLELRARYIYEAWGNHTVHTYNNDNIGNINPIRYRGYYYDVESGLYYCNFRYYNPQWGRFISPDSVDYLDYDSVSDLNLYAYCNNNPVMLMDLTGHSFILAALIGAGIGTLVGWAGQATTDVLSNIWQHGLNMSEWQFSSWQTYVGSIVGGAVGGALTPFLGPVATSMIDGAVSSLVGTTLENATGASNYSFGEIFFSTVLQPLFLE